MPDRIEPGYEASITLRGRGAADPRLACWSAQSWSG